MMVHLQPNMWNILREHTLGVPSAHIRFYILCYSIYSEWLIVLQDVFLQPTHNTIMLHEIIIPRVGLRVFGVTFGLSGGTYSRK